MNPKLQRRRVDDEDDTSERTFDINDGSLLVGAARQAIENFLTKRVLRTPSILEKDPRFEKKLGCFVTLNENNPEHALRGCIGFAEPIYRLSKSLTEAAVAAATEDPRFPSLNIQELNSVLMEVSILSTPRLITVSSQKELPSKIRVGHDGLIMKWDFGAGLLLPQVASELNWDAEEFLMNLSLKAGAPPDQWLLPGTLVYKFRADVFSEEEPRGKVVTNF